MSSLFKNGALVALGQEGENAAWRFLNALSNVTQVDDVRALPQWQDAEVDYRLHLNSGHLVGVEVKYDRHIETSQKVLFELGRIHHTAITPFYPGWGAFSKADYLLVYAPDSLAFRMLRFTDLRQAMQAYTLANRHQWQMYLKVIPSDATRTTLNVLIPLSLVKHWTYAYLPSSRGWVMRQETR
jgi:hypothetical protein